MARHIWCKAVIIHVHTGGKGKYVRLVGKGN